MELDNGLTEQETKVCESLAEAWNVFVTLGGECRDDMQDFRHAINSAQRIIAVRAMRRKHSDYWDK